MSCPKCGSSRVETLHRGKKVGGAVGAAAGAATGAAAGGVLDSNLLDNRKCLNCDHEWHHE